MQLGFYLRNLTQYFNFRYHCDTISSAYCFSNVNVPVTDPRNLLTEFVIITLVSLKSSFPVACVSGFVISHDFVGSGK